MIKEECPIQTGWNVRNDGVCSWLETNKKHRESLVLVIDYMDAGLIHLYEPEYLKLFRASKSSASLGPLEPYLKLKKFQLESRHDDANHNNRTNL